MIKYYKIKDIQENNNLIFDLTLDVIFKNIFLSNECKPYLNLLIKSIFNINGDNLNKYLIIKNCEIPMAINNKSCYSDLICNYRNKDFILEMNRFKTNIILRKNNTYLFKQHSRKSNNKNYYGKYEYTYLINIDNYDLLNKNELIYVSVLNYPSYNICLYNNIKIVHINLAYLRKKYYNKIKLNELEKILVIFIEQRKDKIKNTINKKEIEGVIEYMDKLKFELVNNIATYDREVFLKLEQEEFEKQKINFRNFKNKIEQDKNRIKEDKDKIKYEKYKLSKKEEFLKNKELHMLDNILKKLKDAGIPEQYLKEIDN